MAVLRGRTRAVTTFASLAAGTAAVLVATHAAHPSATASPLTGHRWQLVEVVGGGHTVLIPASPRAGIAFQPDGTVLGEDGINTHDGRYQSGHGTVRISPIGTSAQGYAGSNPVVIAAMQGMSALFAPSAATGSSTVTVTVRADGDLDLAANGYELGFRS